MPKMSADARALTERKADDQTGEGKHQADNDSE